MTRIVAVLPSGPYPAHMIFLDQGVPLGGGDDGVPIFAFYSLSAIANQIRLAHDYCFHEIGLEQLIRERRQAEEKLARAGVYLPEFSELDVKMRATGWFPLIPTLEFQTRVLELTPGLSWVSVFVLRGGRPVLRE